MGLQTTMYGDRLQIVLLGKTNAGKSSLINEITGQPLAIVSDTKGTTTDPVSKAMEILPVGPCLLTDTPGLDDEGELGRKRVEKTKEVLRRADCSKYCTTGRGGRIFRAAATVRAGYAHLVGRT